MGGVVMVLTFSLVYTATKTAQPDLREAGRLVPNGVGTVPPYRHDPSGTIELVSKEQHESSPSAEVTYETACVTGQYQRSDVCN